MTRRGTEEKESMNENQTLRELRGSLEIVSDEDTMLWRYFSFME